MGGMAHALPDQPSAHRSGRATHLGLAGWLLFQLAQPFFDFGQPLGDGDKMLDKMTNSLLWGDFTE